MGDVIRLTDRRPARAGQEGGHPRAVFAFDLASPFTYLAVERVDRMFRDVEYRPVLTEPIVAVHVPDARAEERARALRLPLVWPEPPIDARPAMRAASLAVERGRGAAFVMAASRLAFCGGFSLDDPEVLAEAAAAADLGLDECLAAARDLQRDETMIVEGRWLREHGADRLPVIRVGRTLFCGEERIGEAAAAVRAGAIHRRLRRSTG